MNPLDVAIVVLLVAATLGGYQLGFAARLLAWAGVAIGLVVGSLFVARVVTAFGGDQPDGRVTVAALFLLMTASAGQGLGLTISRLVPRVARPDAIYDRFAGALLGGGGVLVLVWMLTPSLDRRHRLDGTRDAQLHDRALGSRRRSDTTGAVRRAGPGRRRGAVPGRVVTVHDAGRSRATARIDALARGRRAHPAVDGRGRGHRVRPHPGRQRLGRRRRSRRHQRARRRR